MKTNFPEKKAISIAYKDIFYTLSKKEKEVLDNFMKERERNLPCNFSSMRYTEVTVPPNPYPVIDLEGWMKVPRNTNPFPVFNQETTEELIKRLTNEPTSTLFN